MKKSIFVIILFLIIIGCSTNKNFQLKQEECNNCFVEITFFKKKDTIIGGNIILMKKINVKNAQIKNAQIKINYFHNKVLNDISVPLFFDEKLKRYQMFGQDDQLHTIFLHPFENKNFFYQLWVDIDTIDFFGNHKSLKRYASLAKPMSWQISNGYTQSDKNVLIYDQEPFSEFKRKNPELLEFLTKGDSIELEVISPVKQKYKFKAEW
ncbi:hypothetical protein ACI75Y_12910 [Capnocytophaga stomatis]|uniref:hypothetical protein n=1 Tax=Capnocytophaga stomatis TaxID=1848904 RepID=UPI001AC280D0|nr:hypothetical protein [Capnocytophaga stomatis]GIM50589.1 hypothetical protein CAPN003_20410 [Capnocytophaga stomatis]